MPRGRPRKSSSGASSPSGPLASSPTAGSVGESSGAALSTAGTADRPVRNRIAVRKFGDDLHSAFPSSSSANPTHQRLPQKSVRDQDGGHGRVLIHKSFWGDMCSKLACSSCGKRCVQMKTEKLSGLTYKLIMYCTSCGVVLSQVTSSGPDRDCESESEEEIDYDVNWRFVKFFVEEGKTYNDVVIFSKTLGIPVISQKMFDKYREKITKGDN